MRLAAALVLVGCGSSISYDDFADEARDARCGYFVRCGSIATIGDCRTYYDALAIENISLNAAIDAGKTSYDGEAAYHCVDAFDSLACDTTKQTADALAACDDVFTGAGNQGEACAFDLECASDRCVVASCPDACCLGTCEAPRALPGDGNPCVTLCDGDLYCGADDICHAPGLQNDPCNVFTPCAATLFCSDSTGLCVPIPGRGEYCETVCANEGDVCSSAGVCTEAALADEPCTTATDCSRYYICDGERGRCALPAPSPRSPNGTPCGFNTDCESHYCNVVCTDVPLCY